MKNSALNFGLIDKEAAQKLIDEKISRPGILVYIWMTLNCHVKSGRSHKIEIKAIAKELGLHRTTIIRAWGELSRAKLIEPLKGGLTFDIPHVAAARAYASASENSTRAYASKSVSPKKLATAIEKKEKTLKRKLTRNEIEKIKEGLSRK